MTNFADSARAIHIALIQNAARHGFTDSKAHGVLAKHAIEHAIAIENAITKYERIVQPLSQDDHSTHYIAIERFDIANTPDDGQDCWVAIYDALSEEEDSATPWVIWRGKWIESSDTWDFLERGPITPTMLKSVCWAPARCFTESEFADAMKTIKP